MRDVATIISLALVCGLIAALPVYLSSRIQAAADRIRLVEPDQLEFHASKWAYLTWGLCTLLPIALIALGITSASSAAIGYLIFGIIGILISVIAFLSLKKTSVVFNESEVSYTTWGKNLKIPLKKIKRAYASNGFITIKLEDNKGVPMQILFENPAKLLATLNSYAAKNHFS